MKNTWKTVFCIACLATTNITHAAPALSNSLLGFSAGVYAGSSTLSSNLTDYQLDWHGATLNLKNTSLAYGITASYLTNIDGILLGFKADYNDISPKNSLRYATRVNVETKTDGIASALLLAGVLANHTLIYMNTGYGLMLHKGFWREDSDPSDSWNFNNDVSCLVIGAGMKRMIKTHFYVGVSLDYYIANTFKRTNAKGFNMNVSNSLLASKVGIGYIFNS